MPARISARAARHRLGRPLRGDSRPTRTGEEAWLYRVSQLRLEDLDEVLAAPPKDVGEDLVHVVRGLAGGLRERSKRLKSYEVNLPLEIFDFYAERSRRDEQRLSDTLSSAITRDYARQRGADDRVDELLALLRSRPESAGGFDSARLEDALGRLGRGMAALLGVLLSEDRLPEKYHEALREVGLLPKRSSSGTKTSRKR